MPHPRSDADKARALVAADLAAFEDSAAVSIAAELCAALEPGIHLLRPLGAGAMGLVFLGRDPLLKRLVAIKVLSPHLAGDEIAHARFIRESEASAAITHPNVAGIHLVGELPVSQTAYYVMQYIDGRSLAEDLADGVPMSELRAKRLIGEIASALEAAHGRGLVHRDVKPSNIMIEQETDRPVVLDFGISAVLVAEETSNDARLTRAGTYLGTPTYMSPEQATGEPVTGKSDVYALGLIAFELLAGHPPFDGAPVVVMAAHVEKAPPSLHAVRPGIDAHLAELVDRCLRKNPGDRPSAADVAHSLLPGARSLVEWPPPGLEPLRRRGARLAWRWLALGTAALVFFLLLFMRPTLGSPKWIEGEQSVFWGGVMTPTDAMLSEITSSGHAMERPQGDATLVWMFLVSACITILALMILPFVVQTGRFAQAVANGARAGYPWPVVFDVAWDAHDDTAALLNASGIYALMSAGERSRVLRARRLYAVAVVVMVLLAVVAPLLWFSGALRVHGEVSSMIVTPLELTMLASPLVAGAAALMLLRSATRLAKPPRRTAARMLPMQAELVAAWLTLTGRGTRVTSRARVVVVNIASALAAVLLLLVGYVLIVVFLVVFASTTRLVAGRVKAEEWRTSFLVDSTRPMRFTEMDSATVRSAIPAAGTQPDTLAARLVVARAYARPGVLDAPPALAMDIEGARALNTPSPDADIPDDIRLVLADSALPPPVMLKRIEPYTQSPWLGVWRRFAMSPAYPVMWQYRPGLPGARYLWAVPVMRFAPVKDLAYRNSLAGLVALSKGDVATAILRGRENIAAARHFLNGTTLVDNLIGQVIAGIGRGELLTVARVTRDEKLHDEVTRLRATALRWRRQRIPGEALVAMTVDPDSRESIRYVGQLASPGHFGELMFVASAGFCMNSRELLFGTDSARLRLVHDVALASRNPRAGELEALSSDWLADLNAGTLKVTSTGLDMGRSLRFLAPLGWIGLNGFRDRARACLFGLTP